MESFFLNPWAMIAGAALVSVPIIIHLINRIRYKRIRWAAMEFLLKAQRRMKRKLILQQLLLLLLRMLMMALVGLLLGRFLGCGESSDETREMVHVVILDDSPSMADPWRAEGGQPGDAFEQARVVLTDQIAKSAADASTPQTLELLRLTELGTPRSFGRLNNTSIEELRAYLGAYKPSNVRVGLAEGLKKAKELLDAQTGDVGKVVHVLSDFRAVDWAEEGEAIKQAMSDLTAAKVKVHLIDMAHPFRKKDERRAPIHHDNVSIVELQPSKLVVARYDPLEFTLRVKNNGSSELKGVRFDIKVNGDDNKGRAVEIPLLPGNQERSVKFELTFDRTGTDESPLDRFSLVTAHLASGEPGGLVVDNTRHAVVEVREKLPILVVDGKPENRDTRQSDSLYLRPVYTAVFGGFQWTDGTVRDLESTDLSRYVFILLLNVPSLPEAAVKNLEQYTKFGGGVGFFMGPDVRPLEYNRELYRDGTGLFPAPLAEQPSPDIPPEELEMRRFRISQKKFLLRDPAKRTHPALAAMYVDERGQPLRDADQLERVFGFVSIRKYWPVTRLGKWREDKTVTELYCYPTDQKMSDFEASTRGVADQLPIDNPEFEKYRPLLVKYRDELRRLAASSDPLYSLASTLDDLLADQRGVGDATEALLREFWANSKNADLKAEATRLRDRVKFGDPFYLAKEFGRGRVTLITTTAGEAWTDWPSERPGNASFIPIVREMGNYLAGAGTDENRSVGPPIEVRLDATRYKPTARRAFVTHDPETAGPRGANPNPAPVTDLKEQQMVAEQDRLVLKFTEATNPGGYLFSLTGLKPQTPGSQELVETPEFRAYAANIDSAREGDLRRVSGDDVTQLAQGAEFHTAADADWTKSLRDKKSDWSEMTWLFLAFLGLLLFEQFLAMRLSFHANPDDTTAASPTAAAVMRTGS